MFCQNFLVIFISFIYLDSFIISCSVWDHFCLLGGIYYWKYHQISRKSINFYYPFFTQRIFQFIYSARKFFHAEQD